MLLLAIAGIAPLMLVAVLVGVVRWIERVRESRRHTHILAELGSPLSPANAFGAGRGEVITLEGKLVSIDDDGSPDPGRLVSFVLQQTEVIRRDVAGCTNGSRADRWRRSSRRSSRPRSHG